MLPHCCSISNSSLTLFLCFLQDLLKPFKREGANNASVSNIGSFKNSKSIHSLLRFLQEASGIKLHSLSLGAEAL